MVTELPGYQNSIGRLVIPGLLVGELAPVQRPAYQQGLQLVPHLGGRLRLARELGQRAHVQFGRNLREPTVLSSPEKIFRQQVRPLEIPPLKYQIHNPSQRLPRFCPRLPSHHLQDRLCQQFLAHWRL
jgi:hypothetical protein